MKILILRVSAIGDVVHTLPCIFLLKRLYPKAKISWVVQEKASTLLTQQQYLEHVWILRDGFLNVKNLPHTFKIIKDIRKTKWDAILDFQGILKSSIILASLKGKKFGFSSDHARLDLSSHLTKHHTNPIYTNIIQKNLTLADNISLRNWAKENNFLNSQYLNSSPCLENLKDDFFLNYPQNNKDFINDWLKNNKIPKFITIAPNTTWPSKHWPAENWQELLELLSRQENKVKIVLLGKYFGEPGKTLSKYCKDNNLNIFTAPQMDLKTTAYLISKTELLVGPDTGLLHLADFLDKKTIGIFGPTTAVKHGPFLKKENIKTSIQIPCSHPRQKIHGDGSKEQNCMYQLTPKGLFSKIMDLLSNS